jgi:hypothetical protein
MPNHYELEEQHMKCLDPRKASISFVLMLVLLVSVTAVGAFAQTPPLVYNVENTAAAYPAPTFPDFDHLPIVRQLPDPFVFFDGSGRDTSFANLEKHRADWLAGIAQFEEGPKPTCTGDPVKDSVLGVGYTCSVAASYTHGTGNNYTIAVTVTVTPTATGVPNTKSFNVAVVLPTASATCVQPAAGWPFVMGMGSATGSWPASAFNASTNSPSGVTVKPTGCAATVNYPLNSIANYGGGGTAVHANDLFYQLYPNLCAGSTSPSTTAGTCNATHGFPNGSNSGEYAAWAWGLSRVLDAIQQVAALPTPLPLDTTHSATSGCSYAGKMAMWTAALDERVALAIAQENGGGGAPSWRISHEIETQGSVEDINDTSYSWFDTNTLLFSGYNVYKMPVDHHELMALMAPRAMLQTGDSNYYWLGDRSATFDSMAAAQVWDALGIGDRFNYYIDTVHGHCAVPAYQQNATQPILNKFLFGTDTAGLPIRVHEQFEDALLPGAQPTWDPNFWTAWWGTGNPSFTNGGVWNSGGDLVLPVNQSLTLNTGDVVSSGFQLTMPGTHAAGTVTVPTSFTEVDVACTDGTSYTFSVPPPVPSTSAAGYPPISGSPSALSNPQTFTIAANDNNVYPSTPSTTPNPGCANGQPGTVTGAYFFALGKPAPGAGNPGLTGFSTTNGFQASGATDPLSVAVNLTNSTTGAGGTFTPWTTINRLNPYSCTPPGCPLTPTLTWAPPSGIINGTPLSSAQLNAAATSTLISGWTGTGGTSGLPVTAPLAGTFTYDPPAGTVLSPGAHTLNVTFTPTNIITASTTAANAYKTNTISTGSVQITVGSVTLITTETLSTIAGGYQMVVTVQNTGNMTAPNVQLTGATLGATSGATLPASLGDIASGGSASVTLTFPSSVGADGAAVIARLSGTYTGGTFGGSFRAVLP